jgi:single-stranded-DNA-specific exonuclease
MSKKPDVPLLDKAKLQQLLNQRFSNGLSRLSDIPSPSLLQNADKAATRIADAIRQRQRITIVGDYDVDGVTSTALTVLFFRQIPYPVDAIIPNRFTDGYGVSASVLERVNADLVITVDNGINAFDSADICKERNIDLIITDHHTPSEKLPDAYAIVNPKLSGCTYPFKEICGAEVAWLLMALVKKEHGLTIDMSQFLELLAMAVIADVMPLVGINRAIVQAGLKQMMQSRRPASVIIREFLDKSSISSEDISFQIAPRLNAAGRLEDASTALKFLTAESEQQAYKQFEALNQLNQLRKATEAQVTEEAVACVNPNDPVIVVASEQWHEGIVGIVAARLVQHFGKPAIVLNIENKRAKGSARSIGNINIYELIKAEEAILEKFGGHKMAAGLALAADDIEAFREAINTGARRLDPADFHPQEDILGELQGDNIDIDLLNILERFEPYGEANPRPRFLANNAEIVAIKRFGSDRAHSRITLRLFSHEHRPHDILAFRQLLDMPKNRKMTCSYTINKNEYNGRKSLQMMLERIYPDS